MDTPVLTDSPYTPPAEAIPAEAERTAPPARRGPNRRLLLIAGGALALLLVLGVGAAVALGLFRGQASNAPVTLTYWGLWENEAIIQPLIARYQEAHPNVTIKYEQRPIGNHYDSVRSRIKSPSADMPDIVRLHASWVPAMRQWLSPLPASVMSNETYEQTFYPVTKQTLLANDAYYGVPLETDGLALVYNQELFRAAGITAPPQTWDDVRRDAAKLTKRVNNKLSVGGIAMGTTNNVDNYADIVGLLMAQNGVQFTNSRGNVSFQSSISADGRNLGAEALSFYSLFSTTEKYWDETMPNSTQAFVDGQVAMIFVPSWRVLSILDGNPQLQFGVAPVPHLTTRPEQEIGYASYWVEAVPEQSPHQAEAWKFLAFLSEAEQQKTSAAEQAKIRPFAEPYGRVDLASSLENDPLLAPFVRQAPKYQTSFFASDTYATTLNDQINARLAEAIKRSSGNGSTAAEGAAGALTDLAEQVTEILARERAE